jgi:cytochrome c-type biogenesis protein CcmH/NrfF
MFRSLMILILAIPSGGTSGATTTINWAIPATLLLVASICANYFMKRSDREMEEVSISSASSAS